MLPSPARFAVLAALALALGCDSVSHVTTSGDASAAGATPERPAIDGGASHSDRVPDAGRGTADESTDDAGTGCVDGAQDERRCGDGMLGHQTRQCQTGAWSAWSDCALPAECDDGQSDSVACGANGRGTRARHCDAGTWSSFGDCVDPDVCTDASTRVDACGVNGRGEQRSTCANGTWGSWSDCADLDVCTDGTEQRQPCSGSTSMAQRACVHGQWTSWSACAAPAECASGEVETRGCGFNGRGTQKRDCAMGTWSGWSECVDVDVCTDGDVAHEPCGLNGRGLRERTCSAGKWGALSACNDPDTCTDGSKDQRSCGINDRGTQVRSCTAGTYDAWSSCADVDVCKDDATTSSACGLNDRGTQTRTCMAGQWGTFGICNDPDTCVDQRQETGTCGLNGRGTRTRTCANGSFGEWSLCSDPDECKDGSTAGSTCGLNGRGTRARTCANGSFGEWSACNDPDECEDGTTEQRACGLALAGAQTRSCANGRYGAWATCSVVCGNGVTEGPEACDDHNLVNGDGCSAQCAVEHVEWIATVGTPLDDGGPDITVRSDGSIIVTANTFLQTASDVAAHQPFFAALDAHGVEQFRVSFSMANTTYFGFTMDVAPDDSLRVYGYFDGAIGLGDGAFLSAPSGTESAFVASYSAIGQLQWVRQIRHAQSLTRPIVRSRFVTTDGDFVFAGELTKTEPIDVSPAGQIDMPVSSETGQNRTRMYVASLDAEGNLSATSFVGTSDYSSGSTRVQGALGVNGARIVFVSGPPDSKYTFFGGEANQRVVSSEALVISFDAQSQLDWVVPYAGWFYANSASLLAAGDLAIAGEGASRESLVISPAGELLLQKPGTVLGQRSDGSVVLTDRFSHSVQVDGQTLSTALDGFATYAAEYGRDGELHWAHMLSAGNPTGNSRTIQLAHDGSLAMAGDCPQQLGEGVDAESVSGSRCVAKFDDTGRLLWTSTVQGALDSLGAPTLLPAHDGGAWMPVRTSGTTDWAVGTPDQRSVGQVGEIIARYAADGALRYVLYVGQSVHRGAKVLETPSGGLLATYTFDSATPPVTFLPGDPAETQLPLATTDPRGIAVIKLRP